MVTRSAQFRTVQLRELTKLYVLLEYQLWESLSIKLRELTLSKLSRKLNINYSVLRSIRDFPNKSICVNNLIKLSREFDIDFKRIEKSTRAIRFSQTSELEKITFPFNMDIYSWRAICHILGDGTIDKRSLFGSIIWTQNPKNQEEMRTLLEKLSRRPSGNSIRVNYPKGLAYIIMAAIPRLSVEDLKTPKFVQFVIDLPSKYLDWKIQFLTTFLLDDGCISREISFVQKNKIILMKIMKLCDQLAYDHTPYPPYFNKKSRVYRFSLYQIGVLKFYNDLNKIASKDSLLGIWHKTNDLESLVNSYDRKKGFALHRARLFYIELLKILCDDQLHTISELKKNPNLKPFLQGVYTDYLLFRLYYLRDKGLVKQIKKGNKRFSYWKIARITNPEKFLTRFIARYGKNS